MVYIEKAKNTLEELWDPTKETMITFGHSLFAELAVLYFEVKDFCGKVSSSIILALHG